MLVLSFTSTLNHFVVNPLAVRTSALVSPEISVSSSAPPQSLGASHVLPPPPELLLEDEDEELELLDDEDELELLDDEDEELLLDDEDELELLLAPPVPRLPPAPPRALKPVSTGALPQAITPSMKNGSARRRNMGPS
jgi:hypothetical protein